MADNAAETEEVTGELPVEFTKVRNRDLYLAFRDTEQLAQVFRRAHAEMWAVSLEGVTVAMGFKSATAAKCFVLGYYYAHHTGE